jgi:hypothetical protein
LAADVCFQWWLWNYRLDHPLATFVLMELDVLVRNVPLFLALLHNETSQYHIPLGRAVTTLMANETMLRFCAYDHRLAAYCEPSHRYLNGVSLYSPFHLRRLGVLKSEPIYMGFDVDLSEQLMRTNRSAVGMAAQTLVCMLPLDNLGRVIAWMRAEAAPSCPAWHVFHYLWRPEIYPGMRQAKDAYFRGEWWHNATNNSISINNHTL